MLKISFTQKELYKKSPRAWFLHYKLNLREIVTGSALSFGNAIDVGLNVLLLTRDRLAAYQAFLDEWAKYKDDPNIRFSKADLEMDEDGWISLGLKGRMFLDQYSEQVLPRIKQVIAVQIPIEIINEAGEVIDGKADLICEWEDGRIILFDNKTTSVKYGPSAISAEGMQLALYEDALFNQYKIDAVGFITISKKIRKKKLPLVVIEILIDIVPEDLKAQSYEEFSDMIKEVKLGNFPCNSPKCDTVYGECCYKQFCKTNGEDLTGLKYVDYRKKKEGT